MAAICGSALSARRTATTDGRAPDGLAELALTLNVLVYGLARDVLSGWPATSPACLAAAHAGLVIESTLGMGRDTPHAHEH